MITDAILVAIPGRTHCRSGGPCQLHVVFALVALRSHTVFFVSLSLPAAPYNYIFP